MIKEAISKLTKGNNLSFKIAKDVFGELFDSRTTPSQIAAFLTALKIKGETEDEISAAASVVRAKATKIDVRNGLKSKTGIQEPLMDTCGTGGSGLNKFNISTATAFVVSASGVKVAKHGNRAMSSSCGSADVLEALGININTNPRVMEQAIKMVGIGFLYAPLYHPALRKVAQIRREIGIRTIFNILGPLCNPAKASHQLLGVYSPQLTNVLARVLRKLGLKKALVVYGEGLKDEVSLSGSTKLSFLNNKKIRNFSLTPASFGLKNIKIKELRVKNIKESAQAVKSVLSAKRGPSRDIVLANSSACFYVLGKVKNFKQGVKLAADLIDADKAMKKFLEFKEFLEKNA